MLSVFLLPGFLPKYACPLALLEPAGSVSAEIYILFPLYCAAPLAPSPQFLFHQSFGEGGPLCVQN